MFAYAALSVLTATIVSAHLFPSALDPAVRDPRRIWHIETSAPGNDLRTAMRTRGLAPSGGGDMSRAERSARAIVVERLVERVNEAYRRRADGVAIRGRSLDVTFASDMPDERRFEEGPGIAYSRICVGGGGRCGGTLGVQYLDFGNRDAEHECTLQRIGVFAGRICGLRSRLESGVKVAESRFVDGTYRLGDGTEAEDERFLAIRAALEDWGTALGNVTAHEIGHAMGLEHDARSGFVMQARISAEDLSSGSIGFSPASIRSLSSDVGVVASGAAAERRRTRHALSSEAATTLGALVTGALAIGLRGESGRITEVLLGDLALLEKAGMPGEAPAGIVFAIEDGAAHIVELDSPGHAAALVARVRGHLARRGAKDLPFLAEGLASAVPRIAGDAAVDLLALGGPPGVEGPLASIREQAHEALARNLSSFHDLRPLIRLVGHAGATGSVEAVVDAIAAEEVIDLSSAGAEALDALGGRSALKRRLASLPEGAAPTRLKRALARMAPSSIADLEALLGDRDSETAEAAARNLLAAGPVERARLFQAAAGLSSARRRWIEALRVRPR